MDDRATYEWWRRRDEHGPRLQDTNWDREVSPVNGLTEQPRGVEELRVRHLERYLMSMRQRCEEKPARRNLYEEAIRRPTLENDALRSGGTVPPLPTAARPRPPESDTGAGGVRRAKGRWAWRAATYR